jgi:hypothetical protein
MMPVAALYEDKFERPDHGVAVRLEEVDGQYRVSAHFYGKGSMDGARAFVKMLTEMLPLAPEGSRANSVLDTRALDTAPIRSQLILAKWLIQNRHFVDRIAILGAKPMVRRLATAVLKAARFKAVQFVSTPQEASAWTGFGPE